ncbi:MAG TPA: RAMP superfamily CRISPR-associated protein [Methanothrix sp.]|jgi:CRISPR type III-B/RAMP module RAMP protein Cmr6|nr:RAMP superfamily CRISPR-associated protein [Methanothrix sp.]
MTYQEWPTWIYAQQKKEVSDRIQEVVCKPSKREMWMVNHLTPYLFKSDEPLFKGIERATIFYRAYESLNKITTDRSRKVYKWSDDIRSVYRAKLVPKQEISLNDLEKFQPGIPHDFSSIFPPSSWSLHLSFTLRKPYISRDDTDFYILDNPVKKEWIFKVPYIAPSQWKGALRSAMMQELVSGLNCGQIDEGGFKEERLRLWRLFGNEKDGTSDFLNRSLARHLMGSMPEDEEGKHEWKKRLEAKTKEVDESFESELSHRGYHVGDIEGFQGCLHFYPTYFDRIGLEVINPHDRETGAGKNPIYFECVPAGTKGTFTLLYVPLFGPEVTEEEAKADLKAVARGVKAMMTRYGFGAKTSSGFGVVDEEQVNAMLEPKGYQDIWQEAWSEAAR